MKSPPQKRSGPLVDFEGHQDTYRQRVQGSIDFIGRDLDFFTRRKADILTGFLADRLAPPPGLTLLDVGCGIGLTDLHLIPRFKKVHGVDLGKGVLRKASALNPKASYKRYGGGRLPFRDSSLDAAFAICVMHHVPPDARPLFLSEMFRVIRPGRWVLIFEHNPLNPLTRLAVSRCELDKDAFLLGAGEVQGLLRGAGASGIVRRYILFTPWEGALFRALDGALGWLPLGAQYFVAGRK
jgi:SAM-dependent methyltransferase